MLAWLRSKLRLPRIEALDTTPPVTHDMTNRYWSHNFNVIKRYPNGDMYCALWVTPHLRNGHHVLIAMQSGRTARFKVANVEWCHNPRDMFFADLKFQAYEENDNVAD